MIKLKDILKIIEKDNIIDISKLVENDSLLTSSILYCKHKSYNNTIKELEYYCYDCKKLLKYKVISLSSNDDDNVIEILIQK